MVISGPLSLVAYGSPILPNREPRLRFLAVHRDRPSSKALGEIKPPTVVSNVLLKPLHPANEILLYALVRMVQVRGGAIVLASVRRSGGGKRF